MFHQSIGSLSLLNVPIYLRIGSFDFVYYKYLYEYGSLWSESNVNLVLSYLNIYKPDDILAESLLKVWLLVFSNPRLFFLWRRMQRSAAPFDFVVNKLVILPIGCCFELMVFLLFFSENVLRYLQVWSRMLYQFLISFNYEFIFSSFIHLTDFNVQLNEKCLTSQSKSS